MFVKWETEEEEEEHSVVQGKLVQLCDNKGGYDVGTKVKVLLKELSLVSCNAILILPCEPAPSAL